jgi:hypothetical protein
MKEWSIDVKGKRGSDWEISLLRAGNDHGATSWGWCDDDISDVGECTKILVAQYQRCHVSGVQVPASFDVAMELAKVLVEKANNGEGVDY